MRDDLPPEASALLARARGAQASPDAATHARVRRRVAAALAAGAVAAPAPAAASAGMKTFATLPLATKLGLAGVVVALAAVPALLPSSPAPKASNPDAVPRMQAIAKHEASATAEGKAEVGNEPASPALEESARPTSATTPDVRQAHKPAGLSSGSLRAELELLDRASQALDRREPVEARALLDRHRASFPHPALREEREGLALIARCMLEGEAVRGEVEAFLARARHAVLRVRVERACGEAR